MFPNPWYPRSPLFSDPFFSEWDNLLQRQWQEQQAYRQQLLQQQQQQQQQPQQAQLTHKPAHDCTTACAAYCAGNKQQTKPKDNCSAACSNLCKVYHEPSSLTPATARSWDVTTWSDLTPQQIKLEWAGTEPSAKEYVVSAYLPAGMTPADTNISIDELSRLLTVKCETKAHGEERDPHGAIISSHHTSSYTQRSFQLPEDVDMRGISASKFAAVAGSTPAQVIIHLPKLQSTRPQASNIKQIPIR